MAKQRKILLRCNLYFLCTEKPEDLEISLLKRYLEERSTLILKESMMVEPFQFINSIGDSLTVFPVTEEEAIISLK